VSRKEKDKYLRDITLRFEQEKQEHEARRKSSSFEDSHDMRQRRRHLDGGRRHHSPEKQSPMIKIPKYYGDNDLDV